MGLVFSVEGRDKKLKTKRGVVTHRQRRGARVRAAGCPRRGERAGRVRARDLGGRRQEREWDTGPAQRGGTGSGGRLRGRGEAGTAAA